MKRRKRARVGHVITLLLAFCMMFTMALPVMADETTLSAASDPRESIMTISLGIQDDAGNYQPVTYGTCFLVNDEYVLTNHHVVVVDDDWLQIVKEYMGLDLKANDSHIRRFVHISRDIKVEVTVDENVISEVMDFALVKLNKKVYDRKPLTLGDSDSVKIKDAVYAMGFPGDSLTTREYFTKEDVSVTNGTISKITNTGSKDLFEHTADLNHGNSGGPLLDLDDNVIGVNSSGTETKNYAVRINFIKNTMDTFGVPYIEAGATPEPQPEPENNNAGQLPAPDNTAILTELKSVIEKAKMLDTKGYTDDSVAALNDSIGKAETVAKNTEADAASIQGATDDLNQAIKNLEEKSGPNMILIGGSAAAIVIVVVIVVIIIVSGKKKKASKAGASATPAGYMPPTGSGFGATPTPVPVQRPASSPEGAGETTLLDSGSGETTLLGGGAGGAYLIRKKNGEKIVINLPKFKIGKERNRVNYCVSDNTSVSRVHCEIVKKGSDYYVIDNGATNFTFVNGVQLSPRQETLLSNQSVLKLSDEEFEFHVL